MKYYTEGGKEFVENSNSKLRVSTLRQIESPVTKGRVARVLLIQDIVKSSPATDILNPGMLLALSFPPDKANAKSYEWHVGEETQVPIKIDLTNNETMNTEGDPVQKEGDDQTVSVCEKCKEKHFWKENIRGKRRGWCPKCMTQTMHEFSANLKII